jgi:Flp pilus assembly protein TadD
MKLLAVAMLSLTAACAPRSPTELRSGPPSDNVAAAALAGGMPEAALSMSRAVLETDPRNVPALLRQGEALLVLGHSAEAEVCFRRAVAAAPRSDAALLDLGRLQLANGQPVEAEGAFRRALSLKPNQPAAMNDLGIALDLQGRQSARLIRRAAHPLRRRSGLAADSEL